MFYIYEWERPRRDTKLTCGHKPTGKAYKVIISVCREDLTVLPQALEGALQAKPVNPSRLYRLWHWCFGKKPTKPQPRALEHRQAIPERQVNSMAQVKRYTVKAQAGLHLDCGHFIQSGENLVVTRIYTCEKESNWPLTVLMACLQVLQQEKVAPQPNPVPKTYAARNVYTYAQGYHQPPAHPSA